MRLIQQVLSQLLFTRPKKETRDILESGTDKQRKALLIRLAKQANQEQRELDRKYEQMMNQAAQ